MTTIRRKLTIALVLGLVLASVPAFAQATQFFRVDRVLAGDTDIWRVWVPAGPVRVTVDGDGDTDLDLFVVDAQTGVTLAVDDDLTDYCIGYFYMPRSGYISIRISNLGSVYNRYSLAVRY